MVHGVKIITQKTFITNIIRDICLAASVALFAFLMIPPITIIINNDRCFKPTYADALETMHQIKCPWGSKEK